MFLNKAITAGIAGIAMAFASAASAVTITTDAFNGGTAPVVNATVSFGVPHVLTIDIDSEDGETAGGSATFGFTATENLDSIETNSLNPDLGFGGASVVWSTEANGAGTVIASLIGNSAVENGSMFVGFDAGETLWLTATWTSIDQAGSDFDLRVAAVAPVPVPAGVLLMGTAIAGFGIARRRRKS